MSMYKTLHPTNDIDRLYVSRKEVRRAFASIEESVSESIREAEDYKKKNKRRLITVTKHNNRITITKKQTWEEKTKDISSNKHTK